MQFSSIFASLALAASALAESETFGLLLIRSGSSYQNSAIGLVNNGTFAVASSNYVSATITDEGLLSIGDGKYAVVTDSGIFAGADGSATFSIVDGYLEYNGAGFSLTEDYALLAGGSGPNPVAVRPTLADGSVAADFTPGEETSSEEETTTSEEETTTSEEKTTTSEEKTTSAEETVTVTTSSETEESSTFSVQTDNGVAKIGAGAGFIAFAAALLI
ncbi:unnamed protein product [Cyberlindnera jadinii]|uniref:Cell wall protein CWP1 n=1 Tax=Cyberlindnera jadinii (strain ATCC 18201 / CBS 1600 / BCRC 20928 / JCM 3617 / NBRC 0987 / NRRL Y-1542) TaxID=983966 RepID=A0A0H5C899_CYBJN|nr:unnamed protein product [Cyberlindnera jadinii]